jgi:hypothetical protein
MRACLFSRRKELVRFLGGKNRSMPRVERGRVSETPKLSLKPLRVEGQAIALPTHPADASS